MVPGKEDLGLSLSLGTAAPTEEDHDRLMPSLQLNLMMPATTTPMPFMGIQQKAVMPWSDLFSSSSVRGLTTEAPAAALARPSFLKGIDVNRAPAGEREMEEEEEEEEEDGGGASSPNSMVSCVSAGKRGLREETATCSENNDRAFSGGGGSDEEDGGEGSRKKLRLSKDQSAVLEESFKEHNTLNPKQKMALAKQLGLRPRQVEVWFQNRRARTKLKQTEVDCEFLKRCCENLTEENRRLQKEVQELRALKLSPKFYMHMTPPTTLTMCPSCERVAVSTSSATAAGATPSATPSEASTRDNGGRHQYPQQQHMQAQQQSRPFFQHRPMPTVGSAGGGGAAGLPWAPMALRAGAFLDAQTQRT